MHTQHILDLPTAAKLGIAADDEANAVIVCERDADGVIVWSVVCRDADPRTALNASIPALDWRDPDAR